MTTSDLTAIAEVLGWCALTGVVIFLAVRREWRDQDELRDRDRPITPLDWRRP